MRIAIVRHGEASFGADSDENRALTDSGREEILSTSKQLKDWVSEKTVIVHSPFLRTVQTAEILSSTLSLPTVSESVLKAGTHFRHIIEWLQETDLRDIVLVCHNPMVTEITNSLVYGEQALSMPRLVFDTGYACCLECEYPAYGCVDLIKRIIP